KHAKGDARYWKIVDGKLYLNYNKNIQKKWDADIPGFIEKANSEWAAINE
ncbi:MAG TPA: twin-arginine translocation pathway signal protein, partial [Hyphomonas atlantica]|nr:twin-arginine translocation pathway signal protein [Hyphomonas atlantica]